MRFTEEDWQIIALAVHLLWENEWTDESEGAEVRASQYERVLDKVRAHRRERLKRQKSRDNKRAKASSA